MAKHIVMPRWRERADRMLGSTAPLPPSEWLDLEAHCSWDGGNTGAFLGQVRAQLPGVRFVPMFSMSTETLETLPVFAGGRAYFLPIAPGVLYELLPEGAAEAPGSLIPPGEAREGARYELVVSDTYGLRRYRTADLFRCAGHLDGLPDLRFVRRRGLTWSFTGEKLTGGQLELAYARLMEEMPGLCAVHLCLVPSRNGEARLPSYVLALVTGGARLPAGLPPLDELARRFDAILGELNDEYASKRSSERLAAPEVRAVDYDALARAMRGGHGASERGWDSQLKVLPLVPTTWQELGL
jgi:hypothetical protein